MANSTIGRLLVEIGLDSSKFNPELKKIQNNLKSLEKDLKNMDKEFGDVGKSITGLEKKSQLLNKVLSENGKAMNEHIKQRDAYAEMLRKEKEELDTLYSAQERDEKAILQKEKSIQSLINKYQKEENAINKINSIQENYQKQLEQTQEQYNRLINNIETYDERLENISKSTSLTNSELKAQQNILEASSKKFQAYNKQAEIIENSLKGAIETYEEHRKELSRNESELSKLTQTSEEHRKQLSKQESVLESIREYYGENSIEYEQQANLVERLTKRQIEYEQSLASTIEHSDEVRRSLAQSKEEVTEYYKSLKEIGSTKITRGLKYTGETLQSVADATQGASAVGVAVGSGSAAIFMSYESGLAKISTLVNGSEEEIQQIGQSIIRISNETGQSVEGLMESAYDALSSGVEIGELNEFLGTSAQLATAGFTDNASAVRLMTQVMNTYGAEAGNFEQIASKLIKTQDLGVVTVNELASCMSESLSLASTFGMSFENVAAAFAKMTLQGVSASEAGTQVARMMEELGDTGSQVSEILQKKTGKSFTQLCDEGYDLYDILGYIQEYADETGVSMTELWSSSNAGIGALQILSSEGGQFKGILSEIGNSSGLLQTNFDKLSQTSAFKLQSALNELKNSFIEIGASLAPFISAFSNVISGVAKFIDGLGGGTKTAIGYISGLLAVMSPLIGIGGKAISGLSGLVDFLSDLDILGFKFGSNLVDGIGKSFKGEGKKKISTVTKDAFNEAFKEITVGSFAEEIGEEGGEAIAKGFSVGAKSSSKIAKEAIEEVGEGMVEVGTQAAASTGIFSSLWGVISAHPYLTLAAALATATAGIILYNKHAKEKALLEGRETVANLRQEIATEEERIAKLREVAKEWDVLSRKTNRSAKEQERYLELTRQIAELYPELVKGYDENGDPILNLNSNAETYCNTLDRALEKKRRLYEDEVSDQADREREELEKIDRNQYKYSNRTKQEVVNPRTGETSMRYYTGEEIEKREEQSYKKRLEMYEKYEIAKEAIGEEYLNKLKNRSSYKNSTSQQKEDLEQFYGTLDFAALESNQGKGVVESFIGDVDKIKKAIVDSSKITEENSKIWNEAQEAYGNTGNLHNATDSYIEYSEAIGGFDVDAWEKYRAWEEDYIARTGDIEGANRERKKIADHFAEMTGIDTSIWYDLFNVNPEPLAVADEQLKTFLSNYNTGLNNLGKGGLADKLNEEFNSLKDFRQNLESEETITPELLLEWSVDCPTPIQNIVAKMLEDGEITKQETNILTRASIEIENEGEISQETRQAIKELYPDMTDEEIDLMFTVKSDVQNEEEIDNFLKKHDDLDLETEYQIRCSVDNKEEAEELYEMVKNAPEEKRLEIINDFNSAKEEARQLGVTVDELPLEKKMQYQLAFEGDEEVQKAKEGMAELEKYGGKELVTTVTTEFEQADKLDMFYETIGQVDGKTATAFLKQEGAMEALMQCESVEKMLDLLSGKKTIAEVNAETEVAERKLKQIEEDLSATDGKTSNFNIGATDLATPTLNNLQTKQIGDKLFGINATDSATSKINTVKGNNITDKKFGINATDSATSKVNTVKGNNINDKKFTITANDKASSVIGGIKRALSGIVSKTVNVVTNYISKGEKKSVKDPIIVDPVTLQARTQPIVVDDFTATVNSASASILASANTFNNAQDNAVASIQARGYTDTISSSMGWISNSIDYNINLLEDYEAQLNRLGNELEIVSQKAELAFGNSKANLLQNEISLLQQKQQMLAHEKNEYIAMNENLKSMLSSQGFRVDGNGAVTNYANRLLELEKAVERAKDAQDAYEGDDKNRQKSLQDAYDNANERLQKAKETLDKYYDTSSKIGDTEKEWYDVQQAIRDTKNEIYETNREARNFYTDAHIKELEYAYEDLGNKIDLINSKMELGNNREKISLLQDELVLLEKQKQKNNELMNSYKQQQQYFREFLQNRGFSFDYLGDIVNAEDKLAQYRTSDEYESIIDAYEQYMEIQSSTLPDLVNEWADLENEQQDVKETIEEVQKEIKELNKMKTFDFLDELIDKQEKLENQLNILSSKMEVTYGSNKEQLLREQIGLLNQQQLALSNVNNELERQRQYLVMDMKQDGFQFDTNGNISNLDYLLSIAETQDKYDELKEKAEEYQDIQNEITSNNAEWHNLQSEIRDTQDEIQNLQQELREMVYESNLRQLTNEFTVLQNQLDKLENKLELNGTDASEIYKEQLKLIEKQKEATEKQIKYQQEKAKELNGTLISYGFTINDDGTIENATQRLESLKNSLSDDEFSRVNNFLEEYFEIALEEIPNLENQMLSLQKSIEDIEEEKLDKAKQIEDEITKVYEKQIEERIKAIEEERDAQVEALNDAQKAYDRFRADVDYEDDYNEQLSKVQELQNQIEIAKKDDSLSGKKRLEDLMKQLNEEQKSLEELVQNRTDELINNMFSDEIDRISDRADEQIKGIEDVFNETKLAEMVANAMQTGIFEDIDGNISELDDALMEFANNSTDYLGVMGEGLKNELLDNLNVALDYMQQMEKISLDMSKIEYDTARYIGVGYQKGVIEGVVSSNTTNNNDNRVINVSFNPQIEVAGGGTVDETQIMGIMDKAKSDLINEIQHQILNNMK